MNFGFIGYGSIAKKHIQAIAKLYVNANVLLVRRFDNDIDEIFQGITITTTNDYNLLRNVDFIFITNPTAFHTFAIEKVIEFNKPLFIEKPLACELDGLDLLINKLNKTNITNYIACNLRFHPCINYLKNILLPKLVINEINVYCGSYLPDWRPGVDFRKTYSSSASMGGGVHLDLIHELDYCYFLFGNPRTTFGKFTNKSSLKIDAVDYAHYFWEYDQFCLQITLNYFRRDYKRTIEIVAEDATYLVDINNFNIKKNNELIFESTNDISVTYEAQIKYFVDQVIKNENCFNDINEASHVLKLCLNES